MPIVSTGRIIYSRALCRILLDKEKLVDLSFMAYTNDLTINVSIEGKVH